MSDQIPIEAQQAKPEEDLSYNAADGMEIVTGNSSEAAAIQDRIAQMEQETQKLKELHAQMETDQPQPQTDEEKREIDSKSVYIGNVDYESTPLELQQHFSSAGVVHRVTILTNKFTGQPKGFAYLEFADVESVQRAVETLDALSFRDRELSVKPKRTNIPGIGGRGRGRGGRGGRGSFGARGGRGGRGGRGRGRGGDRGFGGPRYTPY